MPAKFMLLPLCILIASTLIPSNVSTMPLKESDNEIDLSDLPPDVSSIEIKDLSEKIGENDDELYKEVMNKVDNDVLNKDEEERSEEIEEKHEEETEEEQDEEIEEKHEEEMEEEEDEEIEEKINEEKNEEQDEEMEKSEEKSDDEIKDSEEEEKDPEGRTSEENDEEPSGESGNDDDDKINDEDKILPTSGDGKDYIEIIEIPDTDDSQKENKGATWYERIKNYFESLRKKFKGQNQ